MEEVGSYAGTARTATMEGIDKAHGYHMTEAQREEVNTLKDKLFDEAVHAAHLAPIDGIPELLKALKARHIPTAIASSSPMDFVSYIVDTLDIRKYFDFIMSGNDLPKSKPNPAIYILTAQHLGVDPKDAVVLEDACQGIIAAKRAGATCIAYRNPNSGNQDLSQADLIVDHIADIDLDTL